MIFKRKILLFSFLVLLCFLCLAGCGDADTPDAVTKTWEIQELLAASELNTAEYPYQGVADWFVLEKGKYERAAYIRYSGVVRYSIDFSRVSAELSEDGGTVIVTLPQLTEEASVENDTDRFRCIYSGKDMKKKYDDAKYYPEILSICESDILVSVHRNESVLTAVKDYTVQYIASLTEQLLSAYDLEISVQWGEDEA